MSDKKKQDDEWEVINPGSAGDEWEMLGPDGKPLPGQFPGLMQGPRPGGLPEDAGTAIMKGLEKLLVAPAAGGLSGATLGWSKEIPGMDQLQQESPGIFGAGELGGSFALGGPIGRAVGKGADLGSKLFKYIGGPQRLGQLIGGAGTDLAASAALTGGANLPEGVDRVEAAKDTLSDPLTLAASILPEGLRSAFGGKKGAEVAARKFTKPSDDILNMEASAAGRSRKFDRNAGDPKGRILIEEGIFDDKAGVVPRTSSSVKSKIDTRLRQRGNEIGGYIKKIDEGGVKYTADNLNDRIRKHLNIGRAETNASKKTKMVDDILEDFKKSNQVDVGDGNMVDMPLDINELFQEKQRIQANVGHSKLKSDELATEMLERVEKAKERSIIELLEEGLDFVEPEALPEFKKAKSAWGALREAQNSLIAADKPGAMGFLNKLQYDHPLAVTIGAGTTLATLGGLMSRNPETAGAAGLGGAGIGAYSQIHPSLWVNFLNRGRRSMTPVLQTIRRQNMSPVNQEDEWETVK